MYTVADIMTRDPVTLDEADDLGLADEIFYLGRLRHLPVVRKKKLVGLVTHRDFLKALAKRGEQRGKTALAGEVMTRKVTTVSPATPLRKALRTMVRNKFGCLPVVSETGALVGILTESDAAKLAARMVTDLDKIDGALTALDAGDVG